MPLAPSPRSTMAQAAPSPKISDDSSCCQSMPREARSAETMAMRRYVPAFSSPAATCSAEIKLTQLLLMSKPGVPGASPATLRMCAAVHGSACTEIAEAEISRSIEAAGRALRASASCSAAAASSAWLASSAA